MKKKLMTTEDLFNRVCSILKEKDRMLEKYPQVAIRDNAARKDVQPGRSIRSIWQ